jgi:outer membrane protein insertion porin family
MTGGIFVRKSFVALCFLLLLSFPLPAGGGQETAVNNIEVQGLRSIEEEEFLYLLGVGPGMVLSGQTLRVGIKRSFKKGIFEEISVEADEAEEGLVRIRVKEKVYVDKVKIKGARIISKRFIKKHLAVNEGEVFSPGLLEREREKLLGLIGRKGFPGAELHFSVEEEDPYRVRVFLRIIEGEPVRVMNIRVTGRPHKEVVSLMGLHEGDIYDLFKLGEDMESIAEHYRELGYLAPSVGPHAFKDGELLLNVDTGMRLVVGIKGNESIGDKVLRGAMPFFMAGEVRDDLVLEAVSNVLGVYHEHGYPYAKVAPVISRGEEETRLDFYVHEGDNVLVGFVRLSGVTLPVKKLKEIMSTGERKVYNLDLLDSDIQRLREFYIALGYKDVDIAEPEVEISQSWATIKIHVTEGRRYEYADITVEGARAAPLEELSGAIKIKRGDPYNEVDISDSRRGIITVCKGGGFPDCRVDVVREVVDGNVKVVFKVNEGEKSFFGKTVIAGNRATESEVIRREIRYEEGEPLDTSQLVKTRQGLYRLGLFRVVDVRTLQGEEDVMDVVIDVEEGKAGTVDLGIGYGEYERQRGFLDIRYRNLFGMNRQVSFMVEASSLSSRQILNYYEPWLLGMDLSAKAYVMREERKEKNIDTGEILYRVKKNTASTGVEKQLTERTKVDLTYEFSVVETFDVDPDVVLSKEDTGTLDISSITPSIAYDTRDDPFDPGRGIFTGLSAKVATGALLSETDFIKGSAYVSGYKRPFRWLVTAVSIRGGAAEGFADTEELPLVERFFLGGRNSVRGYDHDELGPKSGDDTPTGGNAFLAGNLELRIRMWGDWRLVNFLDAGNVWLETKDVRLDELKYTAGVGLQYNTPVGPIRLDYGHKLDREPGESEGEIHFSIGHAF